MLLFRAAKHPPNADFRPTRVGQEFNIGISSPARKLGALPKEAASARKSGFALARAEFWTIFGFGDVDLSRSLSGCFSGTPVHFVGGPLSMANLEILEILCATAFI